MSKIAEQEQMVAVVTGSSSGIGFETSIALAKNGFYTYATMRKLGAENSSNSQHEIKVGVGSLADVSPNAPKADEASL
jgi:NAD(P)-dependent dehydrogenase (short-subunit alcohol dehydrogenase family)